MCRQIQSVGVDYSTAVWQNVPYIKNSGPVRSKAEIAEMFNEKLIEEIKRLCENAYPSEGCGLIVGILPEYDLRGVHSPSDRIVSCANIQGQLHRISPQKYPETGEEAYAMDPKELLTILSDMRKRGEVLKAIYHSHPDSDAGFSSIDYDRAVHFAVEDADIPAGIGPGFPPDRCAKKSMRGPLKPIYQDIVQIIITVCDGNAKDVRFYFWDDLTGEFTEQK